MSFDIATLFTSIPVSLAVIAATKTLKADSYIDKRICLSVNEVCQFLEFCLGGTCFFKREFFRQASHMAMGAEISVMAANLVMEVIEQSTAVVQERIQNILAVHG